VAPGLLKPHPPSGHPGRGTRLEYDFPVDLKCLMANLAAATAFALLTTGCTEAESEGGLVGEWQYHAVGINRADAALGAKEMVRESRVTLHPNHTYEWDSAGYKTHGTWERTDKIVTFTSPTSSRPNSKVILKVRVDGNKLVVIPIDGEAAQSATFWFERVKQGERPER